MAELRYKDQTRNATRSRQRKTLIDLDAFADDEQDVDDSFTGIDDPGVPTVQAVPVTMSQAIPDVNENEELRNQLHAMQKELGQLKRQVKEGGGEGEHPGPTRTNQGTTNQGTSTQGINNGSANNNVLLIGISAVVAVAIAAAVVYFVVLQDDASSPLPTGGATTWAPSPAIPASLKPSTRMTLDEKNAEKLCLDTNLAMLQCLSRNPGNCASRCGSDIAIVEYGVSDCCDIEQLCRTSQCCEECTQLVIAAVSCSLEAASCLNSTCPSDDAPPVIQVTVDTCVDETAETTNETPTTSDVEEDPLILLEDKITSTQQRVQQAVSLFKYRHRRMPTKKLRQSSRGNISTRNVAPKTVGKD